MHPGACCAGRGGCYIARAVERVLVLNASYEPLNVCSLRRAHVLVWKGKAEVLESQGRPLRSSSSTFTRPHVIRLVTYVRVPRGVTKRISRRVLFARDGWKCVYCGTSGNRLTLDHVVPRSRGGTSVWENVVTSCAPCNHRKGDRLLEETSMTLHTPPRPPTPVLFIRLAAEHVPDVWRRYLRGSRPPPRRRRDRATAPWRGRLLPAPPGREPPTSGPGRGP